MLSRSSLTGIAFAPALLALAVAPAHAQNPAAAEALFDQARAAMAQGSFDIACARFRDSDKLDPAVGTRFNLADCEERRGRLATAWSLFRGVLAELAQDDDRRPVAEARAKQLEARLPRVLLTPEPGAPAVRVQVDGVELGEGSWHVALPMDPGTHELRLESADGARRQHLRFELREAELTRLALRFDPAQPDAPADGAVSAPPAPGSSSSRRTWGYVVGGVGVTGVLVGSVAGIITLSKKSTANDNCDDATRTCNETGVAANDSGKTFATISGIGFGVGVIGLAAGAYLLLTSPKAAPAAHSSTPWTERAGWKPQLTLAKRTGFFSVTRPF